MRKLLLIAAIIAVQSGCSTLDETDDNTRSSSGFLLDIPKALDKLPLIYRPTIQQGNVVTQESINQLKPGMAKRQVRFLLGTPMLIDTFHQERWDYVYTTGVGSTPEEIKQAALFFDQDRLVRIEGDYRPMPVTPEDEAKKEVVVSVPDWEPESKGIFRRAAEAVGLTGDDKD